MSRADCIPLFVCTTAAGIYLCGKHESEFQVPGRFYLPVSEHIMAFSSSENIIDQTVESSPLGPDPTDNRDIRLLLIEPPSAELENGANTIFCRIQHHSYSYSNWSDEWKQYASSLGRPLQPRDRLHWRKATQNKPRYIWGDYFALSYTWGDPERKSTIVLDGHEVKVTQNLENALRSLRECPVIPEKTLLWVDALCINQMDKDERASEVQRMRSIYVSAIDTIVYLGSGDPPTEAGIGFINTAGRAWSDPGYLHGEISRYLQETPYNIWDQVTGLINLPYWWRQW